MSVLRRLWHELTRERGRTPHRFYRKGRSSRAGVALLMAISIIVIMTVMVTEIVTSASVRIKLAANQRDEAMAETLAEGGVQFYRLILVASKQLGNSPMIQQYGAMFGVNADTLWQLVPAINSGLLRILLITDGDEDDARDVIGAGGLTRDQVEESQEFETTLDTNFLDFEGDFSTSVTDENRKVSVRNLASDDLTELMMHRDAGLLAGLMSGDDQDSFLRRHDFEKWELIGNLADWTDPDDNRIYLGGAEQSLYERLDEPYLPKNQPFDTIQEIRLVDGWESDQVWHRYGQHLTIYGDGKVNVNTAERRVLEALLFRHISPQPDDTHIGEIIQRINEFRNSPPELGGGIIRDGGTFVNIVQSIARGTVDPALE